MRARFVATVGILGVTLSVPAVLLGQARPPAKAPAAKPAASRPAAKVPRTPDGKPDLQGTYTFSTITPLQRPDALKDKDVLSAEEAAQFEEEENRRQNRDLFDPEKGQPTLGYPPKSQGGVLSYNEFWYERGNQMTEDRRTSLITDPPDGRVPFTEAARKRNAENTFRNNTGYAESYEDRSVVDRCLLGFNAGPPMISGAYNNNMQIVQTSTHLLIFNEMVHEARIIPIDGRPHGTLPRWTGDSRGHWEGDTLVVDTKNFKRETSLTGSSATTTLVERFTRLDDKTIKYEFTVTDPNMYTRPWSAMMPLRAIDERIFEYACHEGNHGLEGILRGARYREKVEAEKK